MLVPAGTRTPAISASVLATRRHEVCGDSKRNTSSNALGIRVWSAHSSSHWRAPVREADQRVGQQMAHDLVPGE